jgi:hypothetical protein
LVYRKRRLIPALLLTAFLATYSFLAFPSQYGPSEAFAQEVPVITGNDLMINLSITPSIVEQGQFSYKIGHVQLYSNITGDPVPAPRDLEIQLSSRNPGVATVPSIVLIPKGIDYVSFEIGMTDETGRSDILAVFGNQIVTRTFEVVEAGAQIPNDIELLIGLPSSKTQIGTEMPFSVYLENNGEIIQAPEDLTIEFDYDRSLVKLSSSVMTMTKGSYYVLGTLTTLEKSGNAFIKASSPTLGLDTVTTVEIAQTQPAFLRVYVFPEVVTTAEKTIDVFVNLVDPLGNPTIAPRDIRLELFSTSHGVANIESTIAVIKKGEFGYHLEQSIFFYSSQEEITIGASAPGLGVGTDTFQVLGESLQSGELKATNKALRVFTPTYGMPSDADSIVVYQLYAVEDDDDDDGSYEPCDGCDPIAVEHHAIDNMTEGQLYPIQSSNLYSLGQGNLNVVSGHITNVKIVDMGTITAGSSYGTAKIASGRQPSIVDVSVSLANAASAAEIVWVTGGLAPVETLIFSPAGKGEASDRYRLPFNQEGTADLFFVGLDSSGRPAKAEDGIEYLIKPTNELTQILPDATFAHRQLRSSQFSSTTLNATVSATPVGVNADQLLYKSSTLDLIFYSSVTAKVSFPFEGVIGFSKPHSIGVVQLVNPFGNPLLASEDAKITLSSSKSGSIQTPSITIPAGKSFVQFDVVTDGRDDSLTVSAYGEGMRSTSADLDPALADLSGSFLELGGLTAGQASTVTISTEQNTSVIWAVPSNLQIVTKEDKAMTYDVASNSYLASAQFVAGRPGDFVIDVTLLKDGHKPARISKTMAFESYQAPLNVIVFHDQTAIEYRKPVTMNLRVIDSNSMPVPEAVVRINPGPNAEVDPNEAVTNSAGLVTFVYTATGTEANGFVTATAEKAGYTLGHQTTNFEIENVPPELPTWLIFGIVGAVAAAAGAGTIYRVKRPKVEQTRRPHRARRLLDDDGSTET